MTVLNPALWLGLLLAALPVVLHLLGRRRLRRQPFSTLEFLQRLQAKRMRRLRIRQWLLLLLRTLAVLLIALAFLRPAIRNAGAAGAGRTESVALLDLSASMSARRADGTPLSKARNAIAQLWKTGGTLALVVADNQEDRDIAPREAQGDPPAWIGRLSTDGRAQSVAPAWVRAANLLRQSGATHRELVWISDFTGAPPDSLPKLPDGTRIWRIPVADSRPVVNGAVTGAHLVEAVVRPEEPAHLDVTFALSGTEKPVKTIAAVTLDGRRVAEGEVTLVPGTSTEHRFPLRVSGAGRHAGEVEIDLEDALALDNRYPFVLTVPGQQKVLLAGDDIPALRYFELALDPQANGGTFDVTIRPGGLEGVDFDGYDAVVLAGRAAPDPTVVRRLQQFVEGGGGLWMLLGERADLTRYSRELLPAFGFGPVAANGGVNRAASRWEDLDRTHPAFAGLFEGKGTYDAPTVRRAFVVREAKGDRVLVRLSDGQPFLLERDPGAGRVWWTPSAADTAWTDWPVSGIFAPMVQQGILYLAGDGHGGGGEGVCGTPIVWQPPDDATGKAGEVRDPLGNLLPAVPGYRAGRRTWVTEATRWPGMYTLLAGGREVDVAAVHVPPSESDLTATPSDKGWPGEVVEPARDETLAEALVRLRRGREISGGLLIAALLALLAETLLAREGRSAGKSEAPEKDAV